MKEFDGKKLGGSAVEGAVPLVEIIYDSGSGDVKHDRTGQVVPPSFPYTVSAPADSTTHHSPLTASRRDQLANWITSKDNQYFAKSYVNRLWGYLFGVGIIEPIDDIRAGNPPTNPELLDALTKEFITSGFNAQQILRTICKSRTYQLSVVANKWNDDDTINYSHAMPRRLPAEALFDAIYAATGATEKLPGVPAGFRAAQLPDAGISVPFLEDFGKPVRESACECERSSGMVLGPILKLINGPTVAEALTDPSSELNQLAARPLSDADLIEEVFIRFLARKPTASEQKLGAEALKAAAADHEKARADLAEYEKQLPEKQAAWEASLGKPVVWRPLDPTELKSSAGATLTRQDDNSVLVSGKLAKDVYTFIAPVDLQSITGLKLEALTDPSLPASGPGRAPNGNFVIHELKATITPKGDSAEHQPQPLKLENASADFSQENYHVAGAIDGNDQTGWAVSPQFGKPHEAVFEVDRSPHAPREETASRSEANKTTGLLTITLSQQFQDGKHLLGKFRLSVTDGDKPLTRPKLPEAVAAALTVPKNDRTAEHSATIAAHYRSLDTELTRLTAQVTTASDQLKNARALGIQDLAWALINNPAFLFNR
jgi:hypothetical protein